MVDYLVGFYGMSTLVDYLMPNFVYIYIYIYIYIRLIGLVYDISTLAGYLIPKTLYTCILNI